MGIDSSISVAFSLHISINGHSEEYWTGMYSPKKNIYQGKFVIWFVQCFIDGNYAKIYVETALYCS